MITIDADLDEEQKNRVQSEVFTNPVTQISSYKPLPVDFDHAAWIGYRPGVKDNAGDTAVEAIEDVLNIKFKRMKRSIHPNGIVFQAKPSQQMTLIRLLPKSWPMTLFSSGKSFL